MHNWIETRILLAWFQKFSTPLMWLNCPSTLSLTTTAEIRFISSASPSKYSYALDDREWPLLFSGNTRSPYNGLSPTNQRPFGWSLQLQKTEKSCFWTFFDNLQRLKCSTGKIRVFLNTWRDWPSEALGQTLCGIAVRPRTITQPKAL